MRRLPISLVASFVLISLVTSCTGTSEVPATPDRTIKVSMRDDNTYEPSEIEVTAGETIAFDVTNQGDLLHELLIGSGAEQREYAEQTEEESHEGHGSSVPGVVIQPRERETFTYVIPVKKERLYFGCHQPGHYEAGMRGELKYHS